VPKAKLEGGRCLIIIGTEGDDRERTRPVRAPQTTIETPGIEYAGKRVQKSGKDCDGSGYLDSGLS
jgi:hypothetical protein